MFHERRGDGGLRRDWGRFGIYVEKNMGRSVCHTGVVGLAIARALAQAEREVLVLEQSATAGTGVSSRNSEGVR